MPNFIIKTHQKNISYKGNQIFILNKGRNSGRPQKEPFTNSFVIQFSSKEDAEMIYWLAYSLWQMKFWHQHLIGSVIPFIRIKCFQSEFDQKVTKMLNDFAQHQKDIESIKALEQQKEHLEKNLKLILELKKCILSRYCQ
ncbi:DUF6943 family protein [Flavobacterium sp. ACAM 123]|uniref:DUF6943 family protein n=1 Tax=Flavobacterium sp. ACAM 123 TaxID=1189620 RepID=UPI0002DD3D76|nr:hypothetical protein [Flavobacterium sp. ACAM 123]